MTRATTTQAKAATSTSAGIDTILRSIVLVRGQKVLLDADLARLYGTTTKRLNEQVKRNAARFPPDFKFRLTADETQALNRSQIATGSRQHSELNRKLTQLEVRVGSHDVELVRVVKAIRALMREPRSKARGIGFLADLS